MNYRALLATMVMGVSMIGANSAQAGAEVGSWYIAPKAVLFDPDKIDRYYTNATTSYKVDDSTGFGLTVGKAINENWDAEAGYVFSIHKAGPGEKTFKSIEGLLNRVFMRNQSFSPYVGFGLNSTTYALPAFGATAHRDWGYLLKVGATLDVGGSQVIKKVLPFVENKNSLQLVGEAGWRADGGLKGCDICVTGTTRYLENRFYNIGLRYNFAK